MIYDVIGIGFGPSNLSVAVTIEDKNKINTKSKSIKALFLERNKEFKWHSGMLINGARMQL